MSKIYASYTLLQTVLKILTIHTGQTYFVAVIPAISSTSLASFTE